MPRADDFLLLQGCLQALEDLLIVLTSGRETHERRQLHLYDAPSRQTLHYLVGLIVRVGLQDERTRPGSGRHTSTDLPLRLQPRQSFFGRQDHAPYKPDYLLRG